MAKVAFPREELTADQQASLKSYHAGLDQDGQPVSKFKYLEGHPKQIRFDAKDGSFNINGDAKTSFKTLTFQPIAWRIFTDNILNMGTKNWAEMFFIDDKNCVSAVLFHGYSVDNIFRLIEPLYYDDLTLADVIIRAIPEKKENTKIQPKGVYYIATFSYTMADATETKLLTDFALDVPIFRQETLTDVANIKTAMNYFNPFVGSRLNDKNSAYQPTGDPSAPAELFLDQPRDGQES
ncbi:hypothetical protein GO755_38990 [Spirosoma sp. HMF4905]|uniref:Uncharacterized protein n=1 Tax=Spirosoma arboris TaxID=2682092 RepID=A0A7K1SQH9_9BACT|nr:hypothetical protein [Spirosoma arboris]MVM36065.1 hypothetical protein [Spirosoma arboris]